MTFLMPLSSTVVYVYNMYMFHSMCMNIACICICIIILCIYPILFVPSAQPSADSFQRRLIANISGGDLTLIVVSLQILASLFLTDHSSDLGERVRPSGRESTHKHNYVCSRVCVCKCTKIIIQINNYTNCAYMYI